MNEVSDDCYGFMLSVNHIYTDLLKFYYTGSRFNSARELAALENLKTENWRELYWQNEYRANTKRLLEHIESLRADLRDILNADYMKDACFGSESYEENSETYSDETYPHNEGEIA